MLASCTLLSPYLCDIIVQDGTLASVARLLVLVMGVCNKSSGRAGWRPAASVQPAARKSLLKLAKRMLAHLPVVSFFLKRVTVRACLQGTLVPSLTGAMGMAEPCAGTRRQKARARTHVVSMRGWYGHDAMELY